MNLGLTQELVDATPQVTVRGLYVQPVTYYNYSPDEARRAWHDSRPGFVGTILKVEVPDAA